jgi:dTDP-4-amino-4,6-dideoxygalactose transaminase
MNELKGFSVPQSRADIGEAEVEAVAHTLRSGWLTAGPAVQEFETAFRDFLGGSGHAIATNSATLGLLVALKALGVGPGDEVVTTTNTFVATAMSAHHLGAKPVLVDIDPRTLTIDPERVEAAVTPRTRVVLPVHLGGLACDMDAIHDIAARHRLSVVEDAAHALPTTWRGRMVGAGASAATVFSFYATKSITTGEGGMITTADSDLARRMRRLRQHGIDRDAFQRLNASSWEYDVCEDGFKANMTDIAASLGLVQLRKLDGMWRRRDQIARRYLTAFADLPLQLPATPLPGDTHGWHLFIVQLLPDAPLTRDGFITAMNARRIQCGVHYPPLHRHSFWRSTLGVEPGAFPEAEKVFSRTVTLPLFSAMSDEEVNYVIDAVRSLLT